METIKDYINEIIIGLIVTAISSIIVFIYKNRKNFKLLKTIKIIKRLKEIGITNFHYNRKQLQDDLDTTGTFISQATSEIYYIGCWLSSSIDGQDMSKRLYDIAMKDASIYICLISPNNKHLDAIGDFFNESIESLHSRLLHIVSTLLSIKDKLPADKRDNLSILIHDKVLTTSFWALDPYIKNKAVFYIDHKTIHGLRYNSYGFVFKITKEKEFAEALWQSYKSVLNSSTEINSLNDLSHAE